MKFEKPSIEEVNHFLRKWDNNVEAVSHESALKTLFLETYPQNTDISEVLVKAATLNSLYSTNIYKKYLRQLAEGIVSLKIDPMLQDEDIVVVAEIATIEMENRKTLFSFASKYCSFHKPSAFPVYDTNVRKALYYFINSEVGFKNRINRLTRKSLYDYHAFVNILCIFRDYYKLDCFTYRELDKYLWQVGAFL